jgi:hypothetical protein
MYVADSKRLTLAGARKRMATAVGQAEQAKRVHACLTC